MAVASGRSIACAACAACVAALAALMGGAAMAVDIDALWDYDQPALSETRFLDALKTESGGSRHPGK